MSKTEAYRGTLKACSADLGHRGTAAESIHRPHEYDRFVLPLTVRRRLCGVLEATKPKLVETARSLMHDIFEDIVNLFAAMGSRRFVVMIDKARSIRVWPASRATSFKCSERTTATSCSSRGPNCAWHRLFGVLLALLHLRKVDIRAGALAGRSLPPVYAEVQPMP
jgi:hypothetical protein